MLHFNQFQFDLKETFSLYHTFISNQINKRTKILSFRSSKPPPLSSSSPSCQSKSAHSVYTKYNNTNERWGMHFTTGYLCSRYVRLQSRCTYSTNMLGFSSNRRRFWIANSLILRKKSFFFFFSFRTQQSEFMLSERYISTCTASICINIILYDKDMRIRKYFI